MMNILIPLSWLITIGISAYGFGRFSSKFFYKDAITSWTYLVTLGIALWIFIGGVLNATQLAYPIALKTIVILGIGLSFSVFLPACRKNKIWQVKKLFLAGIYSSRQVKTRFIIYLIPIFMLVFLVITLMPSKAFNFHDDFHTYFPRIIQMLQKGTVGGNPFDSLGVDSLGAQTFLQAFISIFLNLKYINGFDAIFCFILCAFFLIDFSKKLSLNWVVTVLVLAVFIFINPLLVNISSVYSGSLMIIGLSFSSLLLLETIHTNNLHVLLIRALPTALFLSSLASLKMTFVIFASLYFVILFCSSLLTIPAAKKVVKINIFIGFAAFLLISPWIIVCWDNYHFVLYRFFSEASMPHITSSTSLFPIGSGESSNIFSFQNLFWGGNYFDYNFLSILLTVIYLIFMWSKAKGNNIYKHHIILINTICVSGIISYFILSYLVRAPSAIRYASPVFIAILPIAMLLVFYYLPLAKAGNIANKSTLSINNSIIIPVTLLTGIVVGLFFDTFVSRVERALINRTVISFPISKNYQNFIKYSLGPKSKRRVQAIQNKTKPKEAILAWISAPFLLDFNRNIIFVLSHGGLIQPWVDIPIDADPHALWKYLRKRNIRYIIWDYDNFGMKSPTTFQRYLKSGNPISYKVARYNLYFMKNLRRISESSKIIFNDGGTVAFDICKDSCS